MSKENFKPKRNHRILYISHYLVDRPRQLIKLAYFMDYLQAAKSSISEDIDFIKEVFDMNGLGRIETTAGASGGVVYYPVVAEQEQSDILQLLIESLSQGKRILQGNYIYMSDVLQDPFILNKLGKLIADRYSREHLDAVMTVETKGIGLAVTVARFLNIPYVVARRNSNETMGSTISVNYISGSHQTVKKMELSKDSLNPHSRVLIVDDFLRNGGTVQGMISLLEEFESEAVGICVVGENRIPNSDTLPAYQSLINVQLVYNEIEKQYELDVEAGSFFDHLSSNL